MCLNCKMYLSKLPNIFVCIAKWICWICTMLSALCYHHYAKLLQCSKLSQPHKCFLGAKLWRCWLWCYANTNTYKYKYKYKYKYRYKYKYSLSQPYKYKLPQPYKCSLDAKLWPQCYLLHSHELLRFIGNRVIKD